MNLKTKFAALITVAALAGGITACGNGGDTTSGDGTPGTEEATGGPAVSIKTFMFQPDPLEVEAGTNVKFTNEDRILHTVTEGTRENPVVGGFDEQLDGEGSSAEVTFDEPGMINYVCTIHAGMDGTAVVR